MERTISNYTQIDSLVDANEYLDQVNSPEDPRKRVVLSYNLASINEKRDTSKNRRSRDTSKNRRSGDNSQSMNSRYLSPRDNSGSISSRNLSPRGNNKSIISIASDTDDDFQTKNSIYDSMVTFDEGANTGMIAVDKKSWKETDMCYFCRRKFKQNLLRHHCRFCAYSVCSSCSGHKLKDKRICDVCYYKNENPSVESSKSFYFNNQKLYEAELTEKIKTLKEQNKQKDAQRHNSSLAEENHNLSQKQGLNTLELNILPQKNNFSDLKSKKNMLVQNLVQEQTILDEKRSIVTSLQEKIDSLKSKIEAQNKVWDLGNSKKVDLRTILEDMTNCKETLQHRVDDISINAAHYLLEKGMKSKADIGLIQN